MPHLPYALSIVLAAAPLAARAQPRVFALAPPDTQVTFTTYAMGLFPQSGHFTRFNGALHTDSATPQACSVSIDVEIASLAMADSTRDALATGPKLLDQQHFPHLVYAGSCGGGHASGLLTLHGVTRPITLQTTRDGNQVTAQGTLRRTDFGITGLPGLIGRTVKITFSCALPANLAALVDPPP